MRLCFHFHMQEVRIMLIVSFRVGRMSALVQILGVRLTMPRSRTSLETSQKQLSV